MKKVVFYLGAVLCFFISLTACKKDKDSAWNQQTVTVILKNTDTYQYDMGGFGDEEEASISRQAMHYDTSRIIRGFTTTTLYTYKPTSGYTGTDEVELKAARGSDGESANTRIIITHIKFTITN